MIWSLFRSHRAPATPRRGWKLTRKDAQVLLVICVLLTVYGTKLQASSERADINEKVINAKLGSQGTRRMLTRTTHATPPHASGHAPIIQRNDNGWARWGLGPLVTLHLALLVALTTYRGSYLSAHIRREAFLSAWHPKILHIHSTAESSVSGLCLIPRCPAAFANRSQGQKPTACKRWGESAIGGPSNNGSGLLGLILLGYDTMGRVSDRAHGK